MFSLRNFFARTIGKKAVAVTKRVVENYRAKKLHERLKLIGETNLEVELLNCATTHRINNLALLESHLADEKTRLMLEEAGLTIDSEMCDKMPEIHGNKLDKVKYDLNKTISMYEAVKKLRDKLGETGKQ